MSQDDRTDDARMRDRADDIDDGMIHEWLDGELDATQAAQLEALVASSPRFAARVAEARGLLAASSRILSALDDVPRNVLPGAAASEARPMESKVLRPIAPAAAPPNAPHIARTGARGWSARRWTGIAALLMVGVTGVVVARREPETTRVRESAAISVEGAADAQAADAGGVSNAAAAARVGESLDSGSAVASESLAGSGLAVADAARSEPMAAQMALAPTASASIPPASPAPSEAAGRVAAAQSRAAVSHRADAALADSLSARLRLRAPALQQGTLSLANARAEKAADAPAPIASARSASGAALSVQGGTAMRRMLSAEQSAAFEVDAAPPSDIVAGDLLLAVQRVSCAPGCVQLRVEIARDGRVRRWRQSLGASGSPDTATLTEPALADLSRTVAELRLDTLPAMLRLDGAQCRSVGSLRESLRVEFVHNDELRRVMGLPWCSDGTHVMDKAAAAIEAAADRALSRASGASSRYW